MRKDYIDKLIRIINSLDDNQLLYVLTFVQGIFGKR